MPTQEIAEEYQQACPGIAFTAEPGELESFRVDGELPLLLSRPRSDAEVAAVVSWANERGVALVPRGGGTKMSLGNPLQVKDFVLLSTENLDHFREHDADNLTATVESGVTIADLQKRISEKRQLFPLDPPFLEKATVGGVLAANSSGPRRLLYGSARDAVLGMKVVTPDGKLIKCGGKTVKNVAGYDMSKLFIASLGTLGVIVEATFRLVPVPAASRTVLLGFEALEPAVEATAKLLASSLVPSAIELLDPGAGSRIFHGAALPGSYLLVVLFEGFQDAVERQVNETSQFAPQHSMEVPEAEDESVWRQIRDFASANGDIIRCKILVPISKVGEIVSSAVKMSAVVISHAGSGIVYAILPSESKHPDKIVSRLRSQAVENEGSLVLEFAPRELKEKVGVWGEPESGRGIMKAMRQSFDPKGIMSPGRFVV